MLFELDSLFLSEYVSGQVSRNESYMTYVHKTESVKGISLQDGQGFLDRQIKRKNVHKVGRLRCAERPLFEKENLTRG
ncbi:hypothetical protein QLX08_011163 [Tetragonisca angustula]|uniref:Uncharacterized protein n=1 Tax=Tetragonisca angustula TaxID=166442 RepID=A0AAW0Z938_9HYME